MQIIARAGAGLDNIDVEYANKQGIKVFGANEGNMDAVSEHTIALILSLLNNINKSNLQIKNFIWDREGNKGHELFYKTVGIIGYGFIGKSVAKKIKSFGCNVLAYDKYLTNFSDEFVQEVSLEQIFNQTDILTLHIPLTIETHYLIDFNFISKFKKQIFIINTSRGEIIKLVDLVKGINNEKIIGAGLDVLENEKLNQLSESELKLLKALNEFDNVILTPHIAGWTFESYRKISEVLAEKILEATK